MKAFIIIFVVAIADIGSTASRDSVIQSCSQPGTTCLGYNGADAAPAGSDDCSADVSKCNFAFAAISKGSGSNYKVQLVGKGAGWLSIGFSEADALMREDNLAVLCVSDFEPSVQILQLQDIRPPPEGQPKKPIQFENSGLGSSVSNSKLEVSDGWSVCEFELAPKLSHKTRTIDLKAKAYKIGFAANPSKTIHGPGDEYAGAPFYHEGNRGSSAGALDVFQKL